MPNVDGLTKLPAPAAPPPELASGTVVLYRDDSWDSAGLTLRTDDYLINQRHTMLGNAQLKPDSGFWDPIRKHKLTSGATFVAFNLPVGTAMTLMENVRPVEGNHSISDLRDCGRCVDLVGTGRTEGVDLRAVDMNDWASAFFWREVDLDQGAIELFDDADFGGNRATLFLSEWVSGKVHPIGEWRLQDRVSSVRWRTLGDRQTAQLFDNTDASGGSYGNIKGHGSVKEIANLKSVGLNDRVSAFRWDSIVPEKEVIAPFEIKVVGATFDDALSSVQEGVNRSSLPSPVEVAYTNTSARTVTVSTTDTAVVGVKSTFTEKATVGTPAAGGASETTWSVELSFSYTASKTETVSETKTVGLSVKQTVTAPPMSSYKANLQVMVGKVPPTVYETTAQRWYKQALAGAVKDPDNDGLYKRVEPVKVTIGGSLGSRTNVSIDSWPLAEAAPRAPSA